MRILVQLLIVSIFSFNIHLLSAQVGINTTNPDELVHVAGTTANVRVEGLSNVSPTEYNPDNQGVGSTTRVYVNAQGDLILGSAFDGVGLLVDSANYLDDIENQYNIIIQKGYGSGYNPAGVPIEPNAIFTISTNAILEVNYSVTWNVYNEINNKKKRIDDQRARIIHTGIYFMTNVNDPSDPLEGDPVIVDADGVNINGGPWCIDPNPGTCNLYAGLIGLSGQFYKNSNSEVGEYQFFQTTGTDYVKLPPGTYIALFAARFQVEDTSGNGSAKMWVGTGKDELQIRAYYYD